MPIFFLPSARRKDILLAGTGQFGFATISYFLRKNLGNRFLACFDISDENVQRTARAYKYDKTAQTFSELLAIEGGQYVYIASNHASHAPYAVEALNAGKIVYIEKPIAVSHEQLAKLVTAIRDTEGHLYVGYNRPFSPAIEKLRESIDRSSTPFTINCFVSGHIIPDHHWYRLPNEGTRICGNVGHWLDLVVHILGWRSLPNLLEISIAYSDRETPDDNLAINLTSESGDLIGITLSSRCEPFEGINETINIQKGSSIAKIDDFRRIVIWSDAKIEKYRFWPKDVGHEAAVLQPFRPDGYHRNLEEIVDSSLLMLHITDMVRSREQQSTFSFGEERVRLETISRQS